MLCIQVGEENKYISLPVSFLAFSFARLSVLSLVNAWLLLARIVLIQDAVKQTPLHLSSDCLSNGCPCSATA